MKGAFATLLLLSLILTSSIIPSTMAGLAAPRLCGSKCASRCAKAGMKDRCFKYCGICCRECKCVPSGTFGNKHECPCYRDKMNSKGNPKCP